MKRTLPLVLLVIVVAAISYVLWPPQETPESPDTGQGGLAAESANPEAGALNEAGDPTRQASADRVAVRVFDADGVAVPDGLVVARIDGEAVRASVVGGVAELPRAKELLGVAAHTADAWSPWQEHQGEALQSLQEVRLELTDRAAHLVLHAQYDDRSPAQELRLFLTSDDPRCDAALPEAGWVEATDGVLRSGPLAPGLYGLEVQAANAVPHRDAVTLTSGQQVEEAVTLHRAGAIEGVIHNGADPVEGAVVIAVGAELTQRALSGLDLFRTYGTQPPERDREYSATTSADGSFRIDGLRPGEMILLVHSPDYRPLVVEPGFAVPPLGVAALGVLELQTGNTIEVLVLGQNGEPLEGALVPWSSSAAGILGRVTQLADNSEPTDAEGRRIFRAVPEGLIAVHVEHESGAPAEEVVEFLRGETRTELLELRLSAGASLTGQVVRDADGEPVEMAELNLYSAGGAGLARLTGGDSRSEAHSDADGQFRMDHIPTGEYLLEVKHPEYAPIQVGPLEIAEDFTAPPLRLGYGGTIEVFAQTPDGNPLPAARVALANTLTGSNRVETTDDSGRILFERLTPGTYQVALIGLPNGAQDGQPDSLDIAMAFVPVKAGETKTVELGAAGPTAYVEGIVTKRGQPLANATVIVILTSGAKTATTKDDGAYTLEGVPIGEHILMVQLRTGGIGGGAHYDGLVISHTGTVQHDIALPGAAIQVVVRDLAGGTPIAGMPVSLRPADGSNISGADFGLTDGEGKTSFDAVRPGRYLVAAGRQTLPLLAGEELDRFAARQIQIDVPNTGEYDETVELNLAAGATFRARVSDRDGNYLAGANLFYLGVDGQPLSVLSMKGTNSKGVAQLTGLPEGPGRILVRHPTHGAKEIGINLHAGEVAKQEVTLESGTALYVEVVDGDGAPVGGVLAVAIDARGAPLSTMWTMQESQSVRTAYFSGGAQKLGPLPAGSYTVRLVRPGRPAVEHRVTLSGEPEHRVRLTYDP